MRLIAVYMPEKFYPKHANVFIKGHPMLDVDMCLVHGNQPEGTLLRTGDEDVKCIAMINEELRQKKYKAD